MNLRRGFQVALDNGNELDVPADVVEIAKGLSSGDAEGGSAGIGSWAPAGACVVPAPWEKPKPDGWTRFVCFSDTHGRHNSIPASHRPPADVLLHAGDFTNSGELEQIENFAKWLKEYPASEKVVIAGNHDVTFHEEYYRKTGAARFHGQPGYDCTKARGLLAGSCTYLEDSEVEVRGYRIYGSPWQPEFCDWAFNLQRGEECQKCWAAIPSEVDILMTHGPPHGRGDLCNSGLRAGCVDLLAAMNSRSISVHVAGHIHEGYGLSADDATLFVNASTCTFNYRTEHPPIVFDLPPAELLRKATAEATLTRSAKLIRSGASKCDKQPELP
eukprot:TRINITY_DN20965_c0_g1_i1.p2 TRINITY_DN20965_c0_g1~~TRINITY_DN20965_c0_g1_i1.p2  ORF type:complete len:329 (-),score=49.93 TRINITY_DN20965_c0_g1_i1:1289-2275(-)